MQELAKRVEDLEAKFTELQATVSSLQARTLLPNHLQQVVHDSEEFQSLKVLLESRQWPEAVEASLICNDNDEEKGKRAETILDLLIDLPLEGLAFLDFGCGEGHLIQKAKRQKPRTSVGYDKKASEKWASFDNDDRVTYTTDWEEVQKKGPYNVVLLYDVLDHISGDWQEIINELVRIRQVMSRGARLYVRCHPWCSRHATHMYHTINKAYMHLIFTNDELAELGHPVENMFRCIHPQEQYNDLFRRSGFRIFRSGNGIGQAIEKFFIDTPLVAKRIKQNWRESHNPKLKNGLAFPRQIALQFLDYVLVAK